MRAGKGQVILAGVALWGCAVGAGWGQLPQARLDGMAPVAMKAGETGEVSVKGRDLDGPQSLLFSHPGITAEAVQREEPLLKKAVPVEGQFKVKVNPDVPPGIYDVRVASRFGVSNALGFAVTELPAVALAGGEAPQRVELGNAVAGVMAAEREMEFVVPVAAGQRARVACYGRRLGSRLDGVLKVVDPAGKEVASGTLAGGANDPEVEFTAGVAGDYTVTFFDYVYKGGDGYGYMLEFRAAAGEAVPPADANAVTQEDAGRDGEAGYVQKVGYPAAVAGQFLDSGDRDAYEVEVGGEKRVVVEVRSDRIGQRTDPVVAVDKVEVDGEGKEVVKVVVEGDDWAGPGGRVLGLGHRDPVVSFVSTAEPGRYRVTVWNRFPVRGGAAGYRLEIGEPKPDFRLVAAADYEGLDGNKSEPVSPVVCPGGSAKIRVFAVREGEFGGAVDVRVEGLPAGVTADAVRIPPGREGAVVVVRAAKGTAAWAGAVKVVGEADLGGTKVTREAHYRGGLWSINDASKEEVAAREAGQVVVGVTGVEVPEVQFENPAGGLVMESCRGAKLEIPVKLVMAEEGKLKGNVTVTPVGFEGFANNVPNVGIAPDKKEGVLNLEFKDGGGNVFTAGEFAVVLRGEGQFDYAPGPERKDAAAKEKGEMEAALKVLEEEVGKKAAAKAEAAKKLEEAKKRLGEIKEAGEARTKAEGEVKEAEAAAAAAVQAETEGKAAVEEGKKSVQAADVRVKRETELTASKALKFATYSAPVTVKLASSPVVVTAAAGTAAAGDKGDIVAKVEMKYGFGGGVQLVLVAPGDTKGVKLALPGAVNAENGKDAVMSVGVAADSGAGEVELTLVAKGNFNGVNFEEKVPVKFTATPKKEAAPAAAAGDAKPVEEKKP